MEMINFGKILERSWHVLWNYRVLWIFGVLLALTMGGGGNPNINYQFSGEDWNWNRQPFAPELQDFGNWLERSISPLIQNPEQYIGTLIWIGVGFLLFILVASTITAIIRYVSETATLRMVNDYEETGNKLNFSQGWRLGWSTPAFRLWVIDLILALPAILLTFIFVLAMILGIFFSFGGAGNEPGPLGIVAFIGIFLIFLFFLMVMYVFLGLLRQFFARKTALENAAIGESFRSGWNMFVTHWEDAGLMWLIMVAVGIAAGILGFFAFFLLIPAYVIMLLPALLVSAVPGLIAFGITSLFTSGPLTWLLGVVFAIPLFFTILFLPLIFLTGWFRLYTSIAWTLAYRELKAREGRKVAPETVLPEPGS